MIDYLIYNSKKIGLIWRYILKFVNFLIFRDFSRIFLIFYEFISIYFELKRIKNIFLLCVDVEADVAWEKMHRHMAAYVHATWRTHMHLRACVPVCVSACVRVCAHVCVYVCADNMLIRHDNTWLLSAY